MSESTMRRSRENGSPGESTRSTGRTRYWCITCGRPRSSTYHSRHPPEDPSPLQGLYRRCIHKEVKEDPPLTIYEVYYYYHACSCTNEQPSASMSTPVGPLPYTEDPVYAELPAKESRSRSPSTYRLSGGAPPLVKFWMKPGYQKE